MVTSESVGFNTGTRTWLFANAADQNIVYDIVVYATEGFPTYVSTPTSGDGSYGNAGYVDACAGGTSVTTTQTSVSLPFDVTLYNTNSTTLNIGSNGELTFGSTPLTSSGDAIPLPSLSLGSAPAFFAFWDDLVFGTSGAPGQICYQTLGAAPNRQFVVEWRNMDFAEAPDVGSSLDFEAFLYEGTSEIDTAYHTMTGAAGDVSRRESGTSAWVGMQDDTASVETGTFHEASYGSGISYKYVPSPGCTADTATDPANCGGCGVVCSGTCAAGLCEVTMASGQDEPVAIALDAANIYWTDNYGGPSCNCR